ncbi:GNAT family N-acetyltransferase [Amycolatopsis jiangsuensis]|uniref:Ribosomal protein S18 acetylase RimI-like enzyme n=1 Tax=Amycolatopsis jiangsuensis TaxID=1181879 RepID=A0A840IXA0_9PSEU|nr:GNAT family N-acetyltransferase [Amycolatopsis jiangsuensis]MBB4686119.1 ribosomal protein S18 acetylase RimI-like enzyme [Amycolatopsis jiangsuensis]
MYADEELEMVCSKAWPPVVGEPLGQWRLRWADGFTGRANSALAVGDPGMTVPAALAAVCDFAHARAIPPAVQVVQDSEQERAVAAAGWGEQVGHAAGHRVSVLTGPLPAGPGPGAEVLDGPTSQWWELTVGTSEPSVAERHVMTTGKVGYGVVSADGVTAGAVRGAIVDGWLHVSRLAVRPDFRRRGLARAVLYALAAWGRAQGAEQWVLQVAVDNTGALALYSGLGCTEHHRYRYWGPGQRTCEDPQS